MYSDKICAALVVLSIILLVYSLYQDGFLSSHYPHPEYFLTGRRMYVPQLPDFRSKVIQ